MPYDILASMMQEDENALEILNRLLGRIEILEKRVKLLEESWDEYYESQESLMEQFPDKGGLL